MLKLNVNKEKQLTFEIQIGGVQSDQVISHLRLKVDDVEYGFPANVKQESVTVDLPVLNDIIPRRLKEGEAIDVKLDLVADGHYLEPWSDTFTVSNPLVVEAKIMDDDFKDPKKFSTKLVATGETGEQTQGVVVESVEEHNDINDATEEEMTNRIVDKLSERFASMIPQPPTATIEKKVVVSESKDPVMESKKTDVKNITEDQVYEYMSRAGTGNPKIQKLIYEQAEQAAKSSKPVEVLKQIVKILKKKKQ